MNGLLALLLFASVAVPAASSHDPDPCATPQAGASPVAGFDDCDWSGLIDAIGMSILESGFGRFAFAAPNNATRSAYVPDGWRNGAAWMAHLPSGGGHHWMALLRYESDDALAVSRSRFETGLERAMFVRAEAPNLEPKDACFYLLREETARALCLFERGELLIVGYSFFDLDYADTQLANALALARLLDDALTAVDGRSGLR